MMLMYGKYVRERDGKYVRERDLMYEKYVRERDATHKLIQRIQQVNQVVKEQMEEYVILD
jgi:hypothetical protein